MLIEIETLATETIEMISIQAEDALAKSLEDDCNYSMNSNASADTSSHIKCITSDEVEK